MNRLLLVAYVFATVSCSSKKGVESGENCCGKFYESIQTAEQGRLDAKRQVRERGFRILRYDMPGIRTGYWEPYYRPFKHLGIEEAKEHPMASLDYCKSYNAEMERQLSHRYGSEYQFLREKILPKEGAERIRF